MLGIGGLLLPKGVLETASALAVASSRGDAGAGVCALISKAMGTAAPPSSVEASTALANGPGEALWRKPIVGLPERCAQAANGAAVAALRRVMNSRRLITPEHTRRVSAL